MITVVIADDSLLLRQALTAILETSGRIRVIGEAGNGQEAIDQVKVLRPDVLVLDIEMPLMNGLEALRVLMSDCPLPVFVFSSLAREGISVAIKALEYGAADVLMKPMAGVNKLEEISKLLIEKIEAVAGYSLLAGRIKPFNNSVPLQRRQVDLIAVGSSTGGVKAAVEVIQRLPLLTRPLVWVQHMPASFTSGFAARLNSIGKIRVCEARNGQVLEPNTCYIAPGGFQVRVNRTCSETILNIGGQDRVNGFCPSCDILFESVAKYFARNAIGVILTGMGNDGARGLLKMRRRGSFIIGQNEASCLVYGMSKVAYLAGAVDLETDLCSIPEVLGKLGGAGA